jgi:nucleotide-binding universal stress UspA family protein
MAFKDILVHMDNGERSGAVLDLAIWLAKTHQAHLTGLYVTTHHHYSSQLESVHSAVAAAQAVFMAKTGEAGISSEWLCVDWPVVGEKISTVINLYAYSKDLVIVGQTERSSLSSDSESDLPERIILGSGRPVLIVPYAGTFGSVGERPMVAWKSGRESARAINDAMPFFIKAREVKVLSLGSSEVGESLNRVVAHLARHGVQVKTEQFTVEDISVGDILLNQVWEEGCDLLVMGGYASTSKGFVLGPVARHILKHMTSPVLMTH